MKSLGLPELSNTIQDDPVVVARLTTTHYDTARGIAKTRKIEFLRKKCNGENFVKAYSDGTSAAHTWKRILNESECEDGVYSIVMCNFRIDYETGYVDDYDLFLLPYKD